MGYFFHYTKQRQLSVHISSLGKHRKRKKKHIKAQDKFCFLPFFRACEMMSAALLLMTRVT